MLEEYIENGAFNLKELEEDLFATAYQDSTFDYDRSKNPEDDYLNARYTWQWDGLFEEALREQLESEGYRASDGHARGRFVWIRELNLLMVCPGSEAVPDATFSFNRLEIDDIEFATGVVCDGLFYPCKTAGRVIV